MTDIGDDVTVTTTIKVDGVLTDPDTVVFTVTDPAGADTTPSVANPSVGVEQANVPVTLAGRWTYVWVTTNPDSVEHGYFDVLPDPPRLRPLAQPSDLEARLGRSLTDAEATRAMAYLATASALIRRYTGQVFDTVTGDTVILRPVGSYLVLPQTPVTGVSEVRGINADGTAGTALTGWTWDGLDRIDITTVGFFHSDPWWPWNFGPEAFQVIYDHGSVPIGDDVIGVACDMVLRTLLSPSLVEGMTSERIGQYSYQLGQFSGGAASGTAVRLTEADKDALRSYRRQAGSIQVRI
jgi:hypothetical protein